MSHAQHNLACPECGAPMVLKTTTRYTYRSGAPRKFYGCSKWPACNATHGAHESGEPLGIPANAETKVARIKAHDAFDLLWKSGAMTRKDAYRLMRELMGMTAEECHIGRFSKDECERLVEALERLKTTPRPAAEQAAG